MRRQHPPAHLDCSELRSHPAILQQAEDYNEKLKGISVQKFYHQKLARLFSAFLPQTL